VVDEPWIVVLHTLLCFCLAEQKGHVREAHFRASIDARVSTSEKLRLVVAIINFAAVIKTEAVAPCRSAERVSSLMVNSGQNGRWTIIAFAYSNDRHVMLHVNIVTLC
jgi:hypothetical protein